MAYPVSVSVDQRLTGRNRLTTAFRLILAIPHAILIGGPGASIVLGSGPGDPNWRMGGEAGLLGAVAYFLAVVNWFAIVLTGRPIEPIRDLALFYLRWRTRAIAYMALFADEYPPFGDAPYPARIDVVAPAAARDRLSVAFRVILAIPHFIVLAFVLLGWFITSVIAWVGILLTGHYPEGVYSFGVGAMRWLLRVEAYMLLLVDDYPPFSFD
jgi:hypothetical protein